MLKVVCHRHAARPEYARLLTMGLQQFERRLERMVEGVFAKAFRSGLQPVEIGRRLAREMDLRRQVAPKGTLAPNQFVVALSPEDLARFEPIYDELVAELVSVAKDHAHAEDYSFVGRVTVQLERDDDLSPGMLLITGDMVRSQAGAPANRGPQRRPSQPRPPQQRAQQRPPRSPRPPAPPAGAREGAPTAANPNETIPPGEGSAAGADATLVLPDGRRLVIGPRGLVMGRLPECDLVLADPNVSRRHAEVRPAGGGRFEVADMGSTNGTKLNGAKIRGVEALQDGDGISVGATTLRFEQL